HPNIATLFNFFRQGDDYYMVMEFVRGETLDAMIRRCGALPSDFAVPVFYQALDGIDHAHRMGIVHRDIKPANIMLSQSGLTKVMDFGIARMLGSARLTRQGSVVGTIEYMSPEQIQGSDSDSRSDIYSLGIVLYEMLTGRVPFSSSSEYKLMKLQIESAPAPPRTFSSVTPPHIENAILRALAKNPNDRFQTVADFRDALLAGVPQSVRTAGFGAGFGAGIPGGAPETRVALPQQPPPTRYSDQASNPGAPNSGTANAVAYPPMPSPGQPQVGQPVWQDPTQTQPPPGNYWVNPNTVPAQQPWEAAPRPRRWTWKHSVGLIVGLCVLVAIPFAVWGVMQAL
ncbi:MAG: protein kinase domain-containing protein, partial [Blastocatellia bacterium]